MIGADSPSRGIASCFTRIGGGGGRNGCGGGSWLNDCGTNGGILAPCTILSSGIVLPESECSVIVLSESESYPPPFIVATGLCSHSHEQSNIFYWSLARPFLHSSHRDTIVKQLDRRRGGRGGGWGARRHLIAWLDLRVVVIRTNLQHA